MKRRVFITKSSLAFAGAAFNISSLYQTAGISATPKGGRSKKIIIVGAGLSGLIAGYELRKSGHEVIILEARSTPGGRIRTIREPFTEGLYAEVGASRIHHDHRLVQEYCRLFGLSLVPFYPDEKHDLLEVKGKLKRFKDISSNDYRHYSNRYKSNIHERLHHPIWKIDGGMDQLPKAIAYTLRDSIHYGSPVVKLEQGETYAKAYVERFGERYAFEGERLICSLPFSVLKHLEVQPAFSREKNEAIFQLPYHSTCRILYQTRRRFWKEKLLNGFAVYEHGEIWHPTFDQKGSRGILAYYPGLYTVHNLPHDDRVDYGREQVEQFFPGFKEHVEGDYAKFWDEDQYALGAVSQPEALHDLHGFATRAEDRIHFAGEHLSSFPRWMEGAIESGLRVAIEIGQAD